MFYNSVLAIALSIGGLLLVANPVRAQFGHHGHHGNYGLYGGHHYSTGIGHYLHDNLYHHGHYYGYYPYGYSSYSYPSVYSYYPSAYSYYPSMNLGYYSANPGYGYADPVYAPPLANNVAQVEVTLPDASAQVWVEGVEMTNRGRTRLLESPELVPGKSYTYTIRAAWKNGDEVVGDERKVVVTTGKVVKLDFTRPVPEKMPAPK